MRNCHTELFQVVESLSSHPLVQTMAHLDLSSWSVARLLATTMCECQMSSLLMGWCGRTTSTTQLVVNLSSLWAVAQTIIGSLHKLRRPRRRCNLWACQEMGVTNTMASLSSTHLQAWKRTRMVRIKAQVAACPQVCLWANPIK